MTHQGRSSSIFSKQIHPFKQLAVAIGFTVLFMLIVMLFTHGKEGLNKSFYWEIAFAVLMAFSLFNCIFSLSYKERSNYFGISIACYAILAVCGGLLAYVFSDLTIDEAGSFRWLYIVFTFSFLIFSSIVNLMRTIIEIVKKQDARLRGEG